MRVTMRETTLVAAVKRRLEAAGAYVEKNHGGRWGGTGRPDLEGGWRGYHFGFEVKVPPNTPTKIQEHVLGLIRLAGGYAGVVTSTAQIDEVVNYWPWVCRYDLTPLRPPPDADRGLWCPTCKTDGGLSGR